MSEFDNKNKEQSDSESDEELNPDQNTTQVKKDKKKKKKNKSKNPTSNNSTNMTQPKNQSAMGKIIAERQRLIAEEQARIKALHEEEERKIREEEERLAEIKRKEEEEKERIRKAKHDKIQAKKIAGTYKTKSEKEKIKRNQEKLEQMKKLGILSEDGKIIIRQENFQKSNMGKLNPHLDLESDSDSDSDQDSDQDPDPDSNQNLISNNIQYKSPVFTILGHVDVGKTSLLDNLRQTTVQKHEVGGITQQIGATLLSRDIILKRTYQIDSDNNSNYKIPGLLLVDTPGHEVFTNLRQKGVQLADIAIVIIDIFHGIEPQTKESIKLLMDSNIPFVFALNKIDRLYGFNTKIDSIPIKKIIECQDSNVISDFNSRFRDIRTKIMELGLNAELVWENNSPKDTISVIPISAITSHGIPDLLDYIIKYSQTILQDQITWKDELECVIMEQTNTLGYGYTIDCLIKNGQLSKGDIIQVQTSSGNISTQIKSLLTVPMNKDSKYTTQYIQHDNIKGSCEVKIYAGNLEKALPGTKIKLGTQDDLNNQNDLSNDINKLDQNILEEREQVQSKLTNSIKLDPKGIAIYTSSHGSLEALVQFIRANTELSIPISISQANVGEITKKDLVKLVLSNGDNSPQENLSVLVFEVKVDEDIISYAKDNKIIIFQDSTIYRLFNQYKEYVKKIYEERKNKAKEETVFPCVLKIIESNVFNKKNPLVMGVEITEGNLHLGTPLIILPSKTYIGKVVGIQIDKKDVQVGKTGKSVCIKVDNEENPNIMYGRHFDSKDLLYSNLTRKSVDILKEYFKKDLSKDDVDLLIKLKKHIGF